MLQQASYSQKFGTFLGVYTPSILTILGLIMYLYFGWVVGNVGLGLPRVDKDNEASVAKTIDDMSRGLKTTVCRIQSPFF